MILVRWPGFRLSMVLAVALVVASTIPLESEACSTVNEVSWMLGHWSSRGDNSLSTETWTRVSEDSFEGRGRSFSVPDFELSFEESIRLVPLGGALYFTAKVAHNPYPVSFKLTACSANSAVFENTEHDFPTRIAYHLVEADELRVDVSGPDGNGFSVELSKAKGGRQIALTFDDAPRDGTEHLSGRERTRQLVEKLEQANSPPVIFFSTAGRVDEEGDARMRAYQDAGHYIGNHSYSHQRIDSLGIDGFVADLVKAHDLLSQYENFVPLFRFPFLDEGKDEETRDRLRRELNALGYNNGYVTVDNYDFSMDRLFQLALERGRVINKDTLGRTYVASLMESVRFYADLADQYLDHSPIHTLLLHENDLAAMFIDDLIQELRAEGWTIVDAREAYRDPIDTPDTLFNNQGRVAAIASIKGAQASELIHRAEDTAYLEQLFEEQNAFGPDHPCLANEDAEELNCE